MTAASRQHSFQVSSYKNYLLKPLLWSTYIIFNPTIRSPNGS